MYPRRLFLCLLWFVLCPAALKAERFSLENVTQIVNLRNPQITPDGKSVLVAVSRENLKKNRYDTQIVRVEVESRTQRVLIDQPAGQVRLSPDGKHLAFTRAVDGKMQIFVLPMADVDYLLTANRPPSQIWWISAEGGESER
jgi:hypothetical protein